MLHKIQIVNKRYDINYNESKTLQHYLTLSHLLFCAQTLSYINTIKYLLLNPPTYYLILDIYAYSILITYILKYI